MVAVRMNMFGKLTRTSFDWHPDRLLCKRFNVPHPYPESELVGTIGTGKKREKSSANFAKSSAGLGFSLTQEEVKGKETEVKREIRDEEDFHHRSSHHHTKTTEKENQGHSKGPQHQIDMFEPICPKPDLFAKVFASSDTEEEEHSDEEHSEESEGDEADKIRQSLLARLTSGNKPFKPMTIESQSVDERFATVTVKQEPMVEASATTSAMDAAQPVRLHLYLFQKHRFLSLLLLVVVLIKLFFRNPMEFRRKKICFMALLYLPWSFWNSRRRLTSLNNSASQMSEVIRKRGRKAGRLHLGTVKKAKNDGRSEAEVTVDLTSTTSPAVADVKVLTSFHSSLIQFKSGMVQRTKIAYTWPGGIGLCVSHW